jgi:hypothetical protein
MTMAAQSIPRYDRPFEASSEVDITPQIDRANLEAALTDADLSDGNRDVIRAIVKLARPAVFPGGGVGLEYGPLLKTVTRPDILSRHITETAEHLRAAHVDLLVVPGMSGYPIGAMYSLSSGIPALLLKKQTWNPDSVDELPPGSFIIPSYTGNADTVISADVAGARDILSGIIDRQVSAQAGSDAVQITIRIAGADEIIDKATMATAITENLPLFVCAVANELVSTSADRIAGRSIEVQCDVVAWVTPLLKGYGKTGSVLVHKFGIQPFAGATISAIQIDPPAIGFADLGLIMLGDHP